MGVRRGRELADRANWGGQVCSMSSAGAAVRRPAGRAGSRSASSKRDRRCRGSFQADGVFGPAASGPGTGPVRGCCRPRLEERWRKTFGRRRGSRRRPRRPPTSRFWKDAAPAAGGHSLGPSFQMEEAQPPTRQPGDMSVPPFAKFSNTILTISNLISRTCPGGLARLIPPAVSGFALAPSILKENQRVAPGSGGGVFPERSWRRRRPPSTSSPARPIVFPPLSSQPRRHNLDWQSQDEAAGPTPFGLETRRHRRSLLLEMRTYYRPRPRPVYAAAPHCSMEHLPAPS